MARAIVSLAATAILLPGLITVAKADEARSFFNTLAHRWHKQAPVKSATAATAAATPAADLPIAVPAAAGAEGAAAVPPGEPAAEAAPGTGPAPASNPARGTWQTQQRLGLPLAASDHASDAGVGLAAAAWPITECSFSIGAGTCAERPGQHAPASFAPASFAPASGPAGNPTPTQLASDTANASTPEATLPRTVQAALARLAVPPPVAASLRAASTMAPAYRATLLPLASLAPDQSAPQEALTQFPQTRHPIPRTRAQLAAAAMSGDDAAAAPAADPTPSTRNSVANVTNVLTIQAGMGRVIQLGGNTSSVFAADPKVAEVRPASANSLFVFGVAPGRTTIAALDAAGHAIAQYDVLVEPTDYSATASRNAIGRALPGRGLRVETLGNGLDVQGRVGSATDSERAMLVARGFAPAGQTVTNHLGMTSSIQVNLRVRIVEMSRTLTRDIGVNWSTMAKIGKYTTIAGATANALAALTAPPGTLSLSNTGFNGVIDALAQDELIHVLAEPNLTAISGETASFLVGGEFPIPVAAQNNQVTIEFKQYGVSLAFVPTVISDGHISLKVRPEVSQLTTQGAVQLSAGNATIQVPALTVRRAETTVELGSGQSFAIAGLMQDSVTLDNNAFPFLGELPILGPLFRSDAFRRNETELVIIVTPYIVRPVSDPDTLITPAKGNPVPTDYERLVLMRQIGRPGSGQGQGPGSGPGADTRAARLPAGTGFVIQ